MNYIEPIQFFQPQNDNEVDMINLFNMMTSGMISTEEYSIAMQKKAIAKNTMSNEEIEKIKHYGESIQTLGSFVEAVRKLPGMYIGAIGNSGWRSCVREIFQNAIDEMVKTDSPCHYIRVTYDERDQSCTVEDTGRGIPHGQIIHIFSSAHSSSNYEKKPGQYSSGVHGVGSGVALSLSKHFDICSYVLGEAREVKFTDGEPWKDGEKKIPCPEGRQGTTITMTPALEVLGNITLSCQDIFDLVFKTLMLTNIGDRIDFIGYDTSGKIVIDEELTNKDGIMTDLYLRTQTPLIPPIHFKDDTGFMKAEIAFTYDSADITSAEQITSFSNFTPTLGGKHVDGFIKGVCTFFVKHMNKFYLGEKSKITVINNDVKTGMKAIIVAAHLNPIFIGQSKAILSNEDMEKFISDLTISSLEKWAKTNTTDLNRLCKYFKEIAEIRMKSDDNKVNLSKKYTANIMTKMPKKYVQPSVSEEELFIVEGDSAKGGAVNTRDCKTQGIFPIRGKLPNAFEKSQASMLDNEEVASIITIIGGGYGKNFNIDKVKWKKIVICTDADFDGYHIRTLLLRFFLIYMPELIVSGRVYAAVPPLYSLSVGKGKNIYFTTKLDSTKYIQSQFVKKYTITDMNDKKLSNLQITALFARNIDYVREINIIKDTFAVNPYLLEIALSEYNNYIEIDAVTERENKPVDVFAEFLNFQSSSDKVKKEKLKQSSESFLDVITDNPLKRKFKYTVSPKFDFKKFKKYLEKKFRFVKVSQNANKDVVIGGIVDGKSQTVILNERFISSCSGIINILNTNEAYQYKLNGEVYGLYDIMSIFHNLVPNLNHFKGLGEQEPKELAESVIRPDGLRTLMQFNIEDVKQEIELIRFIDSNKGILLKNVNVTRQELE